MKYLICLTQCLLVLFVNAQDMEWRGPSVDFLHGNLKVSENKRFLIFEDGTPFFYLGDTAWELFHRSNREDTEKYLENRRKKGFTVIQSVVLAEFDGLNTPNAYGERPLIDNNPTKINDKYFRHIDWVVKEAERKGLFIGMLPTWGDKWNKKWGIGPEIFTPENARIFGEILGERYRNSPNLIWILGGDRHIDEVKHMQIIRSMAEGIKKGDKGSHLITFHPQGGRGSSEYFHNEEWLDFNMRQNGHNPHFTGVYENTSKDYGLTPVKPVIDGEPLYEDHPVEFNAEKYGHSTSADVRRPLYWNLFSGAFGHTYGHHSVWQMWQFERVPVNTPLLPWDEAIDQPGAWQMQYARRLIESRPFLTRIPDDSVIVFDEVKTSVPGAGRYRFVATRDIYGSFAMVYAPVSKPFTVRLDVIKGENVIAWWYNPRNGKAIKAGKYFNHGTYRFTPPELGENLDWILVLDDAKARFSAPGKKVYSGNLHLIK